MVHCTINTETKISRGKDIISTKPTELYIDSKASAVPRIDMSNLSCVSNDNSLHAAGDVSKYTRIQTHKNMVVLKLIIIKRRRRECNRNSA